MGNQKHTHVTTQGGLYFRVDGKLQELKKGTPLTLNKGQAKKMIARGMVDPIDKERGADVSGGEDGPGGAEALAEAKKLKAAAEKEAAEAKELKAAAEKQAADAAELANSAKAELDEAKKLAKTAKAELDEAKKLAKTAAKELAAAKKLMGGTGE